MSLNKYLVEFIGTFFLVLTVGCTVLPAEPGVIAPLAIGGVLMVMVFAGGHVSGAHYNRSIVLGACLMKLFSFSDVWVHFAADFAGGAVAAIAYKTVNPGDK